MRKKAEIGILSAIMALIILVIITPALSVFSAYERINSYKSSVDNSLYSITTVNLINNYDNIKYYYYDKPFDFNEDYEKKCFNAVVNYLKLSKNGENYESNTNNIALSNIDFSYNAETYCLTMKYDIKSKFNVFGLSSSISSNQTSSCIIKPKY